MFIRIEDKTQLLAELEKTSERVVVHYRCSDCSDEQVTYDYEANEVIERISTEDRINARYDCTSCGITERSIDSEQIFGLETL